LTVKSTSTPTDYSKLRDFWACSLYISSCSSSGFVLSNITVKAFLEVPTLKSYSAFNSGSLIRRNIYVPSRRVNDYKNAPNWSTWKDEITAIIE